MNITCEQDSTKCAMNVHVASDELNSFFQKIINQHDLTADIGKNSENEIPLEVHTKDVKIMEEVINSCIDAAIDLAIKKYDLMPVNRIHFDGALPCYGQEFAFKLHCEILPEISLPQSLNDLSIKVEAISFEQKEFYAFLQEMRRTQVRLEKVLEKRLPQVNDVVFLEIQGSFQGKTIPGMEKRKIALPLEEKYQEHVEIATAVYSIKVGEQAHTTMKLDANYPIQALQNKEIDIEITLYELHKEILPEVNDDFAKSFDFEKISELYEFITRETLKEKLQSIQHKSEKKLVNTLTENMSFPVPEVLIKIYEKEYAMSMRQRHTESKLDTKALDALIEESCREYKKIIEEDARNQAYLMALAYRENIVVTAEDIEKEIQKLAKQSQQEYQALTEKIHSSGAIYELQDKILANKAMTLLYSKAKKIMVDAQGNEMTPPKK